MTINQIPDINSQKKNIINFVLQEHEIKRLNKTNKTRKILK